MRAESGERRAESQKPAITLRVYSGSRLSTLDPRLPQRGMTLIELLVVIIIVTTIVAAAIPIMTPADDDRATREASRSLNTFITGAQSRAIANNRPFGIGLKRLSQDTDKADDRGVCVQVFYVEQQPPFTGFDRTSAAMVSFDNGPNGGAGQVLVRFVYKPTIEQFATNSDTLPPGWDPEPLPERTIRQGDIVEIAGNLFRFTDTDVDPDNRPYYHPQSGEPNGTLVAVPINSTGQQMNPWCDNRGILIDLSNAPNATYTPLAPYKTRPTPYKILRQPVPTSDEPYQMPEGIAIDLRASGLGQFEYFHWPTLHDNDDPILIMFSPEGKVSRLRYTKLPRFPNSPIFDAPVVDDLFLLIGKRGNIPAPALTSDKTLKRSLFTALNTDDARERAREPINWLQGSSQWILIGSQSGRIATIENALVDPVAVLNTSGAPEESEDLRAYQIIAAREFTRATTRAGGR